MAWFIAATLAAFFIKGLCGFANTLIFQSILSFSVNNADISPVELVLGFPGNAILTWQNRKSLNPRIFLPLTALMLAGNIPGALMLKNMDGRIVKVIFGVVIICIALNMLLGQSKTQRAPKKWMTVIVGIAAGTVMAMLCQGINLHDILTVMYSGFSADTGSDVVNSMLNRGGFTSMLSTIGLLIAAGIFGAPLRTAGVVDVLLAFVERIAKTSRSMSLGVLILHAVFFTITGAYYVSYPVVGGMVKDLYPEYHLDRKNLMRTMLDTGTGLAPMVSWSTTGSYTATTLGVSNLAFAPFAPMLWLSIVFSVIYAVTGIGTAKAKED